MVLVVRVARVVLLLVLVAVAVALIAMAGQTGPVEKVVLAGLLMFCVAMGVRFTSAATHLKKGIVNR